MNIIMMQVQGFLDRANREAVEISDEVLDAFAADCRQALKRQFTEQRSKKFTIRMSNVGRDLCQLQHDQAGTSTEVLPYNHVYKMLTGDLHEAAAVAILKSAGVNVETTQGKVSLEVAGTTINGTYDIKIDGKIYDIKSASSWAFSNKFAEGSFEKLRKDDSFGYVAQGFGYAEAAKAPFGGWIAIDKTTGEWSVSEAPNDPAQYEEARKAALDTITTNVTALLSPPAAPIERCHKDVPEIFYGKPTGNRVLGFNCGYCQYKATCWPEAKQLPQQCGKAQYPKTFWYTEVNNPRTDI